MACDRMPYFVDNYMYEKPCIFVLISDRAFLQKLPFILDFIVGNSNISAFINKKRQNL